MKLVLVLCLAAGLCAAAPATVHGLVLDPSGLPIEAAQVRCANALASTNQQGRFSLDTAACQATITKIGFLAATTQLTPGPDSRIVLQLAGPADSVVVSATRFQSTPEQAAVSANVLDSADFHARDNPVIADTLRELPSIQVVQNGGRGSVTSIFTRGSNSTDTLVLLDGVPLNDPGGQLNFASISSVGIGRMEVIRGPESALFGAEAASGVIQLFTKQGDAEQTTPHGSASYERGNFQTDRWTTDLSGGFGGRFDYYLAAEQLHTVGQFQNSYDRDTTGTVNLGYKLSDATQVRGIFRTYDAHLGVPGQTGLGLVDPGSNEETRDSTVSVRVDDARGPHYLQTAYFGYHRLRDLFNDSDGFDILPVAALVRTSPFGNLQRTYLVSLLNPNGPLPTPSTLPANESVATGAEYLGPYGSLNITGRKVAGYQGSWTHTGGSVVFGYEYQHQNANISSGLVTRDDNGFFFNAQQNFGSRLFLSGGARIEHSTAFGNIGSGRGGLSFQAFGEHGALSSTVLRVSGGRGTLEPSLYDEYVQSFYFHGNPLLKPQNTNTFEAALVQEYLHRRVRTEVSYFRSSYQDLIAFVTDTFQNINRSYGRGIEINAEARPWSKVRISGAYTRLYTRIVSSNSPYDPVVGIGNELLRRPGNSGAVTIAVTPSRWSFVLGARFVGERQDSDFLGLGLNRNTGYENVYVAGSYLLAKHVEPIIRVDNLFNENYQEALGYQALSRSIIGGVRLKF